MRGGHGHGGAGKSKADMPFWQLIGSTLPYIWTRNTLWGKFTFIVSLFFLVAGSIGDLVVPVTLKYAIDSLDSTDPTFPVIPILVYGLASFMSTFCDQARDIFFAYVSSNTERLVALETFEHLQSLSLSFHLKRETGSVLRSVSRGASSFAGLLRIILFQILPVFIQVIVVCVYLFLKYKFYFGLITGGVIVVYFLFTLTTTDWRDKYRRVMNEKDNEFNQKATDALLNFETVKYFNAEEHEEQRYDKALSEYTMANIRSQQTLAMLNNGQAAIITLGTVGSMIMAAKLVVQGTLTVGDFVMLYQFILTLYQPLGFLGTYYRMIKQSMVDVESMILLWKEKADIKDTKDATQLQLYNAAPEIKFENVCFSYSNGVPILKNISFTVAPGKKVAIAGASGAGKSTIARLLYRFYDVTSGRISVDGQDITRVLQNSLRQEIAIVPQDCVLFNDTIAYNIGYGAYAKNKEGATQSQIEEAAALAQLDTFIASQPKQYDTKVGERGLRLSGGEKQRVAIARAILKKPAIMVFDEATSSLDTHTEIAIQGAINAVAAGRTTITVAHRLSTIMNSDKILVLDKGVIVEQGTHEVLLELGGLYAKMWNRQQRTLELQSTLQSLAAEELAHAANQKADKTPSASPTAPTTTTVPVPVGAGEVAIAIPEEKTTDSTSASTTSDSSIPTADAASSNSTTSKAKKKKGKKGGKDSALNEPLLDEHDHAVEEDEENGNSKPSQGRGHGHGHGGGIN